MQLMNAYIFPGQGAQFPGMGKDLYSYSEEAARIFENANELLGFRITDIMFDGSVDELKQTRITQPAIFLHSVLLTRTLADFKPDMVAGHSLGEFSALVASRALTFEDGLMLVSQRAVAMQMACDCEPSTMAAIVGLDDKVIEEVCAGISETVVPANYNCPGQVVISGTCSAVEKACGIFTSLGAKRAMKLVVGGAFHSPLMEPARKMLESAIRSTRFSKPLCPVYQNVNANAVTDPDEIRENLISQLTEPVRWTQTVVNMVEDGATSFTEIGPGKVLQGLVKKISPEVQVSGIEKWVPLP
jgi:[acyl-carrier-protein] S-malonyltransferase